MAFIPRKSSFEFISLPGDTVVKIGVVVNSTDFAVTEARYWGMGGKVCLTGFVERRKTGSGGFKGCG